MENKLQQLTDKLYREGLSKGREQADKVVSQADAEARETLEKARTQAAKIVDDARREAENLRSNTMAELSLAGRGAMGVLRESIASMVVTRTMAGSVHAALLDPEFIKAMILAAASNWGGAQRASLDVLLPAAMRDSFAKEFEASAAALLREGIEIGYSDKVKTGFRIGEKDGGYRVDFTDASLEALVAEFLNERARKILFGDV